MADKTDENIRKRHIERQRRRMRQMKRRRIMTMSCLGLIVLLIIIFFTPIFKIRKVEVTGNTRVTSTEIESKLNNCIGKNLFRYRTGVLIKNIKTIPYISSAEISKSVFSCKLTVTVTECVPAAYIAAGEKNIVIDSTLKVLEVSESVDIDIPELRDVSAVSVNLGNTINMQNDETLEAIKISVPIFEEEGLLEGVEYISFKDLDNITFNYQNRLDVICGDISDFQKKIKLFNQAINTQTLTENSRGTIDLSVSSQAIYSP